MEIICPRCEQDQLSWYAHSWYTDPIILCDECDAIFFNVENIRSWVQYGIDFGSLSTHFGASNTIEKKELFKRLKFISKDFNIEIKSNHILMKNEDLRFVAWLLDDTLTLENKKRIESMKHIKKKYNGMTVEWNIFHDPDNCIVNFIKTIFPNDIYNVSKAL